MLEFFHQFDNLPLPEMLTSIQEDMLLAGFTAQEAQQAIQISQVAKPIMHLGYNPREQLYQTDIRKMLGQVHGRAMFHTIPGEVFGEEFGQVGELCFQVKGTGNDRAAIMDIVEGIGNGVEVNYAGFHVYSKPLRAYSGLRVPGALRKSEALREYINGLVAASCVMEELSISGQARDIVSAGLVLPLAVASQPSLSQAVLAAEINQHGIDKIDPLVTLLSSVPAAQRVTNKTQLTTPEAIANMSDISLVEKLAENIITLLSRGMMWHHSSWHPQNIYNSPYAAMVMADAADFIFLEDYTSADYLAELSKQAAQEGIQLPQINSQWVRESLLVEALFDNHFLPVLDMDGKASASTITFYEKLLDRKLSQQELDFVTMEQHERATSDNLKQVVRQMAREILARCYDPEKWQSAVQKRDELAQKYNLQPALDAHLGMAMGLAVYK
jgi:hypothetical protein